jgi:hypothetical protein
VLSLPPATVGRFRDGRLELRRYGRRRPYWQLDLAAHERGARAAELSRRERDAAVEEVGALPPP